MVADLRGAKFLDCDMSQVKIVDSCLVDVDVSGYVDNLVVNGVDVTRSWTPSWTGGIRNVCSSGRCGLPPTTVRCGTRSSGSGRTRLPEPVRHERVGGEWSFVETMRHLVFITDAWASRTVLDEPTPYHRLGLPQTAYAPADARVLGMDLDARPSYAEVMECAPAAWR